MNRMFISFGVLAAVAMAGMTEQILYSCPVMNSSSNINEIAAARRKTRRPKAIRRRRK